MEAQVALLIDYENVGLDSIHPLLQQLSKRGRFIIKRAYSDWSSQAAKRSVISSLGIEAVHHFGQTRARKNASDISLAVDAVEILYRLPVDIFVIVSSDSDFVPLIRKLRSSGKTVIGAGRKSAVSDALVASCDEYIFLESLEKPAAAKKAQHDATAQAELPRNWDRKIHDRWSQRGTGSIQGSLAAGDAASVLGATNLKASRFSTLERLLKASEYLTRHWRREGNVILKR